MGVYEEHPLTTCFIDATCGHVDDTGFVPVASQAVHMVVPMRFTAFNPSYYEFLMRPMMSVTWSNVALSSRMRRWVLSTAWMTVV